MTAFSLPRLSRRSILKQSLAASSVVVAGCGGNDGAETATEDPLRKALGLQDASTASGSSAGPLAEFQREAGKATRRKYRGEQTYLFQTVSAKTIRSRVPGGSDYLWDLFGPTYQYVDLHSGWLWSKAGGDWLDANLTPNGSASWFSAPTSATSGSTTVAPYEVDVSVALKYTQSKNRWCAFLLVARNAPRTLATPFNTQQSAPYIDVVYVDGRTERLACRLMAPSDPKSSTPLTTAPTTSLPAFVEFDRPRAAVASARLGFVVTAHWSGNNPSVDGYLLDPPVNREPARKGVAATSGRLDEGLEAASSIIGVHRYVDGTQLTDFCHQGEQNYGAEKNFDPAIYGTGPQDLNKFPHAGQGKWINTSPAWSLVPSSYRGEGFKPLASGLGALRIVMPKTPNVADGSVVGYAGTLAGNGMIFLPESMFGRLGRLFVRYYFRLGTPYEASADRRLHVYNEPSLPVWTTYAGKFGIAPDHSTSIGGVSGSSGGGAGWQMRLSWYDCDAGTQGPAENAWAPGFHLYDYYWQNPPGHNYGKGDGNMSERWGQRGAAGGALYAGQWYCMETELKLNSVTAGQSGYKEDGELRAWVDGRLVYERTGMVFRTLPIVNMSYNPDKLRPCRELGVRGLWLDWFHGGKTVATIDRTSFYTGLAYGKEYIGPMKL